MKIEPRTLKGFRDFLPKEARKRLNVIDELSWIFVRFGFEPLITPTLEYEEILLGKYGDEGDKLMYRFEDNGQRRVALRYDQTVPLARVVSQYKNDLAFPFKRSQISNVFRAENTQKGRFREFTQCDIDIVGSNTLESDTEILEVVRCVLDVLEFENYKILVNDRRVFEGIPQEAITIMDKLKKIGSENVRKELTEKGYDPDILDKITQSQPTDDLRFIMQNFSNPSKLIFEPTLARGLDYYTGLIIEVEIEEYSGGSIGGGGRYNNLVGMFDNQPVPAVGFAFGFDRLMEALDELGIQVKGQYYVSKALVTVSNTELRKNSMAVTNLLRKTMAVEQWLGDSTDLEKQFRYAEKKEIPYVVVPLNENEVELRFKNKDGSINKENVSIEELIQKLR